MYPYTTPVERLQEASTSEGGLPADQIRYALSQWFLARGYGRRARRILLEDAATLIRHHRRHNTSAKLNHTRKKRRKLLKSGIDVDRIKSCLDSDFALYC